MIEVIKASDCANNIGDYDVHIHNAIIIPQNVTNGEIIQALFPNGAVAVMSYPSNKVGFITRDGNPDDNYVWYPTSWWNAKYKAESEDKECTKVQ